MSRGGLSQLADRIVVVTGAASGIGSATALAFAREGSALALCDVDAERLEQTAATARTAGAARVFSEVVDVGQAPAMERFAARVMTEVGVPDVLVNNAGVALMGGFLHTSLEDWKWITDTNLWGVVHGCHFFLPAMVRRGRGGHVVNVASAAGFLNSEALCAYGTTKYAVVGLSEALRDELDAHGIGVSVVCPGFVNTPIVKSMRVRGEREPDAVRERVAAWYRKRNFAPEDVARAVLDAVRRDRPFVPVAPEAWGLYALKRVMPQQLPRLLRRFGGRFGPERPR
ncbi:MAG TPA: SDR family NAD(P)-dependent oxidoreductase [Polyangiaceae bacterium]|jgi:NAD(P)-dependent dehydrogenase (short-subunit alcohol dehydrogenase family)|nr:SDR family NAD(P)-dependent oxidoreductase [Polyangiaceae bacterium]